MAEARITESQFLARLEKRKTQLAQSAKSVPMSFMDDEAIIDLFDLKKKSRTVTAKVSKIIFGIDKNKNEYIQFSYIVTTPEFKGVRVSKNHTLDVKNKEKYAKAADRVYQDIQRLGYETADWGTAAPKKLLATIKEINEEKPSVKLSLASNTPIPEKGKPEKTFLQLSVIKVIGEDEEEEEDEDVGVEEETEEEEEETISETPDDTWIGLTAIYEGGEVELTKWNPRKKVFTVYSETEDETYTVSPDDLTWEEE